MERVEFKLHFEEPSENKQYVMIRAGKGKRDQSSMYIDKVPYSYIEGLIWNKYREYGNEDISKIPSSEWERIIEGFKKAKSKLVTSSKQDIKQILKFEIMGESYDLDQVTNQMDLFISFLEQFIIWFEEFMKKEKKIYIFK